MCLITLAVHAHPDYPLIVAANRDEFFARETQSMHLWHDHPIIAGRDLEAGGTWMGVSTQGRIAMVTNYRESQRSSHAHRSRGELTTDFLNSAYNRQTYLNELSQQQDEYQGFNLIIGDMKDLLDHKQAFSYFSNRSASSSKNDEKELNKGIFSLSNALLDSPWPKVEKSTQAMQNVIRELGGELTELGDIKSALFNELKDRQLAPQHLLPDTGVDKALEHTLSSRFIDAALTDYRYGTRVSTCLVLHKSGALTLEEITYNSKGDEQERLEHSLQL